jgi:hypothetical protein
VARGLGWGKAGSGMNNLDHISESLETIFLCYNTQNSLPRIRNEKNSDPGWKKFGSGINIPDPQHWDYGIFEKKTK